MVRFSDYLIRAYEDGDVSILCSGKVEYATMLGQYGLQCDFEEGTDEYERVLAAARTVGDAIALLDEVLSQEKGVDI